MCGHVCAQQFKLKNRTNHQRGKCKGEIEFNSPTLCAAAKDGHPRTLKDQRVRHPHATSTASLLALSPRWYHPFVANMLRKKLLERLGHPRGYAAHQSAAPAEAVDLNRLFRRQDLDQGRSQE